MLDVFQWLILFLFASVIFSACSNLMYAHKAHNVPVLVKWIGITSSVMVLQAASYILLQIEWIVEDHGNDVGDTTDVLWLFYDYFTGFCLLAYAKTLDVYLKWQSEACENDYYGRRRHTDS
jgi:hypothetical protein